MEGIEQTDQVIFSGEAREHGRKPGQSAGARVHVHGEQSSRNFLHIKGARQRVVSHSR